LRNEAKANGKSFDVMLEERKASTNVGGVEKGVHSGTEGDGKSQEPIKHHRSSGQAHEEKSFQEA
jgi:rhamnogalacturonyl hydrolase YesR